MTTVTGTEAARSGGGRSIRWLLLVTSMVVAVVAFLASNSGRAGADGFLVGCPSGPSSSFNSLFLAGIQVEPADPNDPPIVLTMDTTQLNTALADATGVARNLDSDADGLPDLRWNVELLTPDVSQ